MDFVIRVVLIAPYAIPLVALALNAWRLYVIYRDSPKQRPHDVSAERRPVPVKLTTWTSELKQLGFQRLGEIELVLPAVGAIKALTRRTERHTAWMFIDPDHTTEAAIVERLVQFSSRHADGSFVETMYPIGDRIKGPDLVINRVRSSIADAYRLHRSVLTERAPVNGAPELMESMADQQIHDREFRIRHARRQLRGPLLLRGLLPITATAIFIGLLGWSSLPAVDVIARALSR